VAILVILGIVISGPIFIKRKKNSQETISNTVMSSITTTTTKLSSTTTTTKLSSTTTTTKLSTTTTTTKLSTTTTAKRGICLQERKISYFSYNYSTFS
jgi:hypothetical protein